MERYLMERMTLIERELTFCRLIRMRGYKKYEVCNSQYKFNVTCTEVKGIFVVGKNKLIKFNVLNRSETLIGEFNSIQEAKEILAELGDTDFRCDEERVWKIKRASIEVNGIVIECSHPYISEAEEGEENE